MKVITAIEDYIPKKDDITVFLAGGISDCDNWQQKVIDYLNNEDHTEHLVLFNPRRDNFPINDPSASQKQIEWEFYKIQSADIFSMYFCESKSNQPICLYELGRNIPVFINKYNNWYDRILITCESNYSRKNDVVIQTYLATGIKGFASDDGNAKIHAAKIYITYHILKNTK